MKVRAAVRIDVTLGLALALGSTALPLTSKAFEARALLLMADNDVWLAVARASSA